MKTPLRVYFDLQNGQVIQMTGNFNDGTLQVNNTVEEEIPKYHSLSERNRETFDVLELPFGAYSQDFATCTGYRVNPTTKTLEFSYPDPSAPEEPPVYQPPLSEEVNTLQTKSTQHNTQLGQLLLKSAKKDIENNTLRQQNADLLLRVARLELP